MIECNPDDDWQPTKRLISHFHQPDAELFLSWMSVFLFTLMFLFFRSIAGPFLNPAGEPRRAVSSSVYFNLMATLYIWLVSATALAIVPHFSNHYNIIIAAALFFPMTFASVAALVLGRFCVRLLYYASIPTKVIGDAGAIAWNSNVVYSERNGSSASPPSPGAALSESIRANIGDAPVMTAFQRPFRKLVKSSALASASLCFLYAHCWSRSLSALKVSKDDGAGAVCRAVFSPFVFGVYKGQSGGADEVCIWLVWTTVILANLFMFGQDEFAGKHCVRRRFRDGELPEDNEEELEEEIENGSQHLEPANHSKERPQDTQEMVPWYSIVLIYSVFDILVAMKVFLGRFDARSMQPALQSAIRHDTKEENGSRKADDCELEWQRLKRVYPGCFFVMNPNTEALEGDMWFDFVADTGDGFNSSYQVARMLAQPKLAVKRGDEEHQLPRGSFLVIGGDLAYPDPTEESYETRFFRPYEDAMAPPPSFRRTAISTEKPALPVRGWTNCFRPCESNNPREKDVLQRYNGPCAFAIPGNHDWFDGLATYSRFILSRDWLGGWLMPQQRSYFALKLLQGWWLFAADLGLSTDIDIDQFKFFADVAASMKDSDAVIIVTHEPHWVLDADANHSTNELAEANLRELMNNHLKGKVRLRLAGDLHHYTRHVPLTPQARLVPLQKKRSRSLAVERSRNSVNDSSFAVNEPELIVSGGGGAFLHGTHTFSKYICVGEKRQEYMRVGCYPDEKTSLALGWLNLFQFRWRNWRLDIIWAIAYFGVASSLFPLCGVYKDYLQHDHNPIKFLAWLLMKLSALFWQILSSGRVSLVFSVAIVYALFLLSDSNLKPMVRLFWGVSHGVIHLAAALLCLLFIECVAEWIIAENIVKVTTSSEAEVAATPEDDAIDLASCLYDEYTQHFSHVFTDFTSVNSTMISQASPKYDLSSMNAFERLHAHAYEALLILLKWLFDRPLLSMTLNVFDIPGIIAQKHTDMCEILCEDSTPCMLSSDPGKFQLIDRVTMMSYLAGVFLYFVVISIPFAGGVFGAWLALILNVCKAQYNEGFSSLRIQHYKNILKLHIDEKGELEVYCLGLHRVPKKWIKDPEWCGNREIRRHRSADSIRDNNSGNGIAPSWSETKPSKWIPPRERKSYKPEIVDYTCISKMRTPHLKMDPTRKKLFRSSSF